MTSKAMDKNNIFCLIFGIYCSNMEYNVLFEISLSANIISLDL